MINEKNPPVDKPDQDDEKGETIHELAHRHLMDQHHTTTDEEMRNAKLDLGEEIEMDDENLTDVDNTTVLPSTDEETDEDEDNDNKKNNSDPNIPNPYDVLSS